MERAPTSPLDRPDPDALLRRVEAEERAAARGRFKIFFGFAPGVGKTYRMLQVARDLVAVSRPSVDVAVGAIETHGRFDTAALLLGLELLPRRQLPYRGRTLEEFDLDAALARRPRLLILDELAHTNAPGSRHPKRWQDLLELLDAGIDVYTTLNVQHVESLNDVVATITHVTVRETVPDSVLDRADEIELVDIAPEELLTRLREGKVYLPEQASRAALHFFQRGNLLALREIALRRMAERVDADVQAFREAHGVRETWATGERLMVCVGPAPASAKLVRAARRVAAGLRCPWTAAWVEPAAALGDEDRARLDQHLQLAESLGAEVARLSGARAADALLDHARRRGVTRILVGKPGRRRWLDRWRGSVLEDLVRGSGDVDIHVISGDAGEERAPRIGPGLRRTSPLRAYATAAGAVAATTALAGGAKSVGIPDVEMLYLLGVMLSALRAGRGPSLLAAGLSVAAYDFFFVPPEFTFRVSDARYFLTFGMMFGISVVLSTLTLRLRRGEQAASQREERTATLYAVSRDLGSAIGAEAVAAVSARHAARVMGGAAVVLTGAPGEPLEPRGAWPDRFAVAPAEQGVARWALEHGAPAGRGTSTLPASEVICLPLGVAGRPSGVLALRPEGGATPDADQREFLEALGRQIGFALDRVRLGDEARLAALRARTEELRSTLLSTVSHDLRTPLATILGAATSLRDDPDLAPPARRDLLEAICEEADRMSRLVSDLLDMTRLQAGAVTLRREWVPVVELMGAALGRVERALARHRVTTSLPDDLPLAWVDPVLVEQLLVNLLENAAKHTPPGTEVELRATSAADGLALEVADRGPGIAPGEEERIFERFHRAPGARAPGAGLGLAIARAIAEAHGGRLVASNRDGGGALFRLALPPAAQPPSPPSPPAEAP